MDAQNTSQNGLAGAISSAIAPVLSQAQTSLVEDVNDTFGGEGGAAAPVAAPATPSTPAAPSLSTPQPSVQPGFQPAMPIVPSRGGLGNSQVLMKLLENQRQMREQMNTMNRINQSPFQPSNVPPGIFRGLGPGINNFGGTLAEPQAGPQYPTQLLAAGGKTEARAVQNQGRGDDTMLVHMTPGEVSGLQALAMQYGGSLTVNPKTGLVEAGFLKSLLPTLIGAGLMMVPGMQGVGAGYIGAGVGALEFARTGDLGKGIMAGLGAYGGAGLAGAAQAAGAAAGQQAATQGAEAALYDQALGGAAVAPPAYTAPTTFMGNVAEAGRGAGALVSSGGYGDVARTAAMESLGGGKGLAMQAGAALAGPALEPAPMPEIAQPEYNYEGPYKPTKREVVYPGADRDPADSSEFLFFRNTNPYPGFQSAPESLYQLAEGGATTAPPEGYVAGRDAEFVYGFQPMAAQVPEIQAEAARQNEMVQAPAMSDGDGGDYMGPGTPINRVNSPLPREARMSIADQIKAAQMERAAAAAAIAADNTGSPNDFSGNDGGGGFMSTSEGHAMGAAANPDRDDGGYGLARGGEVNMHNNGFVVDAHTVSEVGNGSSNAGIERFMAIGGRPIVGPGDGTSDSIPANIDGIQPAMVARDEVYMSPTDVAAYGGGSLKVGEKKLYKLMEKAHASRKKNGRGQSTGLQQLVS